jgi:hypothetical protein
MPKDGQVHKVFQQISAELVGCEAAITAHMAAAQIISQVTGHWGVASVTPEYLVKRVSQLNEKILTIDVEEVKDNLADLTLAVPALQFARANTIPNMGNANAHIAIPAFLITLESVEPWSVLTQRVTILRQQ